MAKNFIITCGWIIVNIILIWKLLWGLLLNVINIDFQVNLRLLWVSDYILKTSPSLYNSIDKFLYTTF